MKKTAVLFMLMALVLSLPVMASDFTCGTITVDGLISEGEWDAAEWVELPCPKDNVSLTGRIKLMNDKDYIYLLAESTDDLVCDTVTPNWNAEMSLDCLEFWMTVDVEGAKNAASYDNAANSMAACLDHLGNFSWNGGDARAQAGIQYDCTFDGAKTTVYEVAIPIMDGVPGGTIGLNVSFNDTDDENASRCGYVVLSDAVNSWWSSPANLSSFTLADYIEPAIEAAEGENAVTTAPQTFDAVMLAACVLACSGTGLVISRKNGKR